jgi:hypothetical protein
MKCHWTIDIEEGTSPIDAALDSFFTLQTHGTSANCFVVTDEVGHETEVDLEEYWESDIGLKVSKARARRFTRYFIIAAIDGSEEPCQVRGPYDDERTDLDAMQRQFAASMRYLVMELNALEIMVRPVRQPTTRRG